MATPVKTKSLDATHRVRLDIVMLKKGLKIGIGQIRQIMGDRAANAAAIFRAIQAASEAGCDLVALPECSLAGWLSSEARRIAEEIPGPFTNEISTLAQRLGIAVAVGMEERCGERIYNTAVLIGRDGEIVARHRKINELGIGLSLYTRGESLSVSQFEGRTIALSICADSWRPEITDALYLMGARLIISPSAWAVVAGGESTNIAWISEAYRARAEGRDLYIVSPNGVGDVTDGPWKGRLLQGNSLVTGPDGVNLSTGPENEPALLIVEIP